MSLPIITILIFYFTAIAAGSNSLPISKQLSPCNPGDDCNLGNWEPCTADNQCASKWCGCSGGAELLCLPNQFYSKDCIDEEPTCNPASGCRIPPCCSVNNWLPCFVDSDCVSSRCGCNLATNMICLPDSKYSKDCQGTPEFPSPSPSPDPKVTESPRPSPSTIFNPQTGGDDTPLSKDLTVWPNVKSFRNSEQWIVDNHDKLRLMQPRFLVINFANGYGVGGRDELVPGLTLNMTDLYMKVNSFFRSLQEGSRYHARTKKKTEPFLDPKVYKIVDLQDKNGHANSDYFPRGSELPDEPGVRLVGYSKLYSQEYAKYWDEKDEKTGKYLTLGELHDRGYFHEVIMIANQVGGDGVPKDQITARIMEVSMMAQAWDDNLKKIDSAWVKNGAGWDQQDDIKLDEVEKHDNSMLWSGRSLRIYFMNAERGAGCLVHSLGHEFEFRYVHSRVVAPGTSYHFKTPLPYMHKIFTRFAGFDLKERLNAPFPNLYDGGNQYTYSKCNSKNVCRTLNYGAGKIKKYVASCGNVHHPPGAKEGYDYFPGKGVRSFCERFMYKKEKKKPISKAKWQHLVDNRWIDGDCGGEFLVYWMQNMPGRNNKALDEDGKPMKNWWPFMYY